MSRRSGDSQNGHAGGSIPIDEVYAELRSLAASYLKRERSDHTLRPTELVHEAYLRVVGRAEPVAGRTHFLALGAIAMRAVLVDHARRKLAQKRGGGFQKITLDDSLAILDSPIHDVLSVHEALNKLAGFDPLAAEVVQLRIFGGLTWEEVAKSQGISERWARVEWEHARAWLRRELDDHPGS